MSWFIVAVKKYAVFEGRARRKEYWYFILFYTIFAVAVGFVDVLTLTQIPEFAIGFLSIVYCLAMVLPTLAVSVRRLHDSGRCGWWWWINFVPGVGTIVFLVFMVLDSQPQDNRYGPNPKALAEG